MIPRPRVVRVAPLLFVTNPNVTACPLARLPVPSYTVAVMILVPPASRELGDALIYIRYPFAAEEVDILEMTTIPVAPVTLAWTVSWASVVGLVAPAV